MKISHIHNEHEQAVVMVRAGMMYVDVANHVHGAGITISRLDNSS